MTPEHPLRRRTDQPREFLLDAALEVGSLLVVVGPLWLILWLWSR